jgi:hypothetical protein
MFIEGKQVYISWIAVLPEYQKKKIGGEICSFLMRKTPKHLEKLALVRINNLPSIRILMKELRMGTAKLQKIDKSIIGSKETNFVMTSHIPPLLDSEKIQSLPLIQREDMIREHREILIPISDGEEEDLNDNSRSLFANLFRLGFAIKGLYRSDELGLRLDKSCFYCVRDLKMN